MIQVVRFRFAKVVVVVVATLQLKEERSAGGQELSLVLGQYDRKKKDGMHSEAWGRI